MSSFGQPRLIDPRGHRFGAAFSAVLLLLAFVIGQPVIVAAVAVALGVSAWFGTRYFGTRAPVAVRPEAAAHRPAQGLEVEWPPRFAQAIGFLVLAAASILFLAGLPTLAWLLTGAVVVLQTLLAATGYCLGCRLYFLSWKAPVVFRRLARSDERVPGTAAVRPRSTCLAALRLTVFARSAAPPGRHRHASPDQSTTTLLAWDGSMRTGTVAPGSARERAASGTRLPISTW